MTDPRLTDAEIIQADPAYRAPFWRVTLTLLAAFWLSVAVGVFIVVRGW